ncbi:MAG: T9SS type A sorting domain-containing protein [Flavobacteriaceae bacterium]
MKKTVLLFLFFNACVYGQIVNIPDANFKNKLVTGNCNDTDADLVGDTPVDINNDGEIQVSEAEAVAGLIIENANIMDLAGIESFSNLQTLRCAHNQIANVNVSSLSSLVWLDFSYNPTATFNINGLQQLNFIGCSFTNITALDFTTNPSIVDVWASDCPQLISVNASDRVGILLYLENSFNVQDLNLHGCQLADGYINSSYLNNAHNLVNVDLSDNLFTTGLMVNGSNLTSLNIANCTNLRSLVCSGPFTSIDLSGLDNLWELAIHAPLNSINLNNLPNLSVLDLASFNGGSSQISNLNLSVVPNLTFLYCIGHQLTQLDLSNQHQLQELYCSDNQLTSLNTLNCPALTRIVCERNPITELDVSANNQLNLLTCGSPELTSVNLKNGIGETLELYNANNLAFICVDDSQINQIQTVVHNSANPDTVVNSYCSFTPGGDFNTISGKITIDLDHNGCDENDAASTNNILVKITGNNLNGATFTNQNGDYRYYTSSGDYTITPHLEHPEYFTATPASITVNFPTQENLSSVQNFCIVPNETHPDLEVILSPLSGARPGFDAYYQIIFKNKGNVNLSGQINLNFDDAHIDFVSASPNVDSQSINNLYWTFSNLGPFETRIITLVFNLNSPTENPPLNAGNSLHFVAQSNFSEGESTPYDNAFELNQLVVNSYDPNTKSCLEGNTIAATEIGKYVHYNINFENIGTSEAINIVVKDTINTQMFDMNSLQLLYASHPVEIKIRDSVVEFIFRGIHLPPSNGGPIGGHGNVLFKIKTLPTLQVGDEIANTANIFFDYNHPIETNEARSAYANLSQPIFVKDESISLLPNPAKDKITVSALYALKSIEIYDAQGRLLQTIIDNNKTKNIDLSSYVRGVYLVKINTQKGSAVQKLIKE